MTICANHVGWLQRFIISVDSFHFNSETMRYCILMYSAESLAPKSILQPLVKLPMLVLGPMIFVDPLYQGISPTENNHMAITVGKSPHFSHRNVTSIQSKTIFHCQPFLSFSVEFYLRRLLWKNLPDFLTSKWVRFGSLLRCVFSPLNHTPAWQCQVTPIRIAPCFQRHVGWMISECIKKNSGNYLKKKRQIYINQYSPVRACSWAIQL